MQLIYNQNDGFAGSFLLLNSLVVVNIFFRSLNHQCYFRVPHSLANCLHMLASQIIVNWWYELMFEHIHKCIEGKVAASWVASPGGRKWNLILLKYIHFSSKLKKVESITFIESSRFLSESEQNHTQDAGYRNPRGNPTPRLRGMDRDSTLGSWTGF